MRRALPLLVAGALLAPAAPAPAAIDGVVLHRETDPAYAGETVHFTASVSGRPAGLVLYDWGLECGPLGPFDWTTNTASGGFDRPFQPVGEHAVCVRAHDNEASVTDALTFTAGDRGNHPPVAALTVTPSIAPVGGAITFDATGSSDADGNPLRFRFDLDGEQGYEIDAGTTGKLTQTYVEPIGFKAGVQVIDTSNAQDSTSVEVTVGDPTPLKLRLAVRVKGRTVRARVTTGRRARVRVQVRQPNATFLAGGRVRMKKRSATLRLTLRRAVPKIVVIASATDRNGVRARAVRRLKL